MGGVIENCWRAVIIANAINFHASRSSKLAVLSNRTPAVAQERNDMNLNYFLDIANVILLVGYSVRDILWLRLLAVASSFISIPYFALQPTLLQTPIIWSCVFATINLFQSWRL